MNSVDFLCASTPQTAFTGKKPKINRRKTKEILYSASKVATDLLNKDKPLEEQKAKAIRDSLGKVLEFFSKKLRHITDFSEEIVEDLKFRRLERTNPAEANAIKMIDSLKEIGESLKDVK